VAPKKPSIIRHAIILRISVPRTSSHHETFHDVRNNESMLHSICPPECASAVMFWKIKQLSEKGILDTDFLVSREATCRADMPTGVRMWPQHRLRLAIIETDRP
jgi:hypothetical protein